MRRFLVAVSAMLLLLAWHPKSAEAAICVTSYSCQPICPTDLDNFCEMRMPQYCYLVDDLCYEAAPCPDGPGEWNDVYYTYCHYDNLY